MANSRVEENWQCLAKTISKNKQYKANTAYIYKIEQYKPHLKKNNIYIRLHILQKGKRILLHMWHHCVTSDISNWVSHI